MSICTITLKGKLLSTNSIYKSACRGRVAMVYMSKKGKNIKYDYVQQIIKQYKKKPLSGDLEVSIDLYFHDKRRRDWDNYHKLTMDACNGVLWEDDEQIQAAHVRKFYDKENPRVEIKVH